jgi:hypothetical protein
MKKTAIIILMIAFCAVKAAAQKETKKSSMGFGLEAGVPVGSYSDLYTSEFGITVRFSYHAGPGFLTLTTGAIGLLPKKIKGQSEKAGLQIPVRAGYKYIIHQHFFVMGEAGFASTRIYYGSQGKVQYGTQASFLAAPSAGVQFNVFEISIRYEIHPGDAGSIAGVRLGFNF